jgi:hypothetical protein
MPPSRWRYVHRSWSLCVGGCRTKRAIHVQRLRLRSQALKRGVRFSGRWRQRLGSGVRILNRSSRGADRNSDLQVLWADGECVFCREESHTDGNGAGVLAVRPASEHPSPATLDRLAHEYGLKDELDDAWAARPLQLVRERGQTILMLKDPGGEPLDRLIGPPMEIGKFLRSPYRPRLAGYTDADSFTRTSSQCMFLSMCRPAKSG